MVTATAIKAVELGLLKFPPPGQSFIGRHGNQKQYVIDTRGAGGNIVLRKLIVDEMRQRLNQLPSVEVIAGIVKSGTVWASWLAWEENIAFANVLLDGPRASGLKREVEGDVSGKKVILIDNWMRTGTSLAKAIEVVTRSGGLVSGVLLITHEPEAKLSFPLVAVWQLQELLEAAQQLGFLDATKVM